MIILEMHNVKTKIINIEELPLKILDQICYQCSYQKISFNKEPRQYLINPDNGIVFTGLVPYIIHILKQNGIEYQLIDKRLKPNKHINFQMNSQLQLRDYQQRIVDNISSRDVIQAACSAGKALTLDTKILTNTGWVEMRDIRVGNLVFDELGNQCHVTAIYPQSVKKTIYKVTFSDGTVIKCCDEHLWKFSTDGINYQTDKLVNIPVGAYVPFTKPIQFKNIFECSKIYIDPYLIGVFISAGKYNVQNNYIKIYNVVNINEINRYLQKFGYNLIDNIIYLGKNKRFDNIINQLFTNKTQILKSYLLGAEVIRDEMLRGIMDVSPNKNLILLVNNYFADDLNFLIRSLGFILTLKSGLINKNDKNWYFKKQQVDKLKIVKIEQTNIKQFMKCITVDSPCHTYVIENFVVTHNTFIMANVIKKFGVKSLVLTSIASLAVQLKNELESFFNIKVGICTGKFNDYYNCDIIVGTPQSLLNNRSILETVEALFVDECHLLPAQQMFQVAGNCRNAYYRIGFSASPWRDDDCDLLLSAAINIRNPHKSILSSELIRKGIVTPVKITYFYSNQSFNSGKTDYFAIYNDNIVYNENRNNMITTIAQKHFQQNQPTLILFKSIEHGKILLQQLQAKLKTKNFLYSYKNQIFELNPVTMCDGTDSLDFREAVFQAVRENHVKILLGSTIADTGLSITNLSVLILAGGGKSSTRAFQRIGRIQRKYPGKSVAFVYDFFDEHPTLRRHSQLRYDLMSIEPEFKQEVKSFNEFC